MSEPDWTHDGGHQPALNLAEGGSHDDPSHGTIAFAMPVEGAEALESADGGAPRRWRFPKLLTDLVARAIGLVRGLVKARGRTADRPEADAAEGTRADAEDRPEADAAEGTELGESGPTTSRRPPSIWSRLPLANARRETRVGVAALLSFLILVTALIVRRKSATPSTLMALNGPESAVSAQGPDGTDPPGADDPPAKVTPDDRPGNRSGPGQVEEPVRPDPPEVPSPRAAGPADAHARLTGGDTPPLRPELAPPPDESSPGPPPRPSFPVKGEDGAGISLPPRLDAGAPDRDKTSKDEPGRTPPPPVIPETPPTAGSPSTGPELPPATAATDQAQAPSTGTAPAPPPVEDPPAPTPAPSPAPARPSPSPPMPVIDEPTKPTNDLPSLDPAPLPKPTEPATKPEAPKPKEEPKPAEPKPVEPPPAATDGADSNPFEAPAATGTPRTKPPEEPRPTTSAGGTRPVEAAPKLVPAPSPDDPIGRPADPNAGDGASPPARTKPAPRPADPEGSDPPPSAAKLPPGAVPIPNLGRRRPLESVPEPARLAPAPATIPDAPMPREAVGARDRVEPILHTVRPDENFWTISRDYYQSGRFYKALHAANRKLVPEIDKLYVGTTIKVPPVDELDPTRIEPPPRSRSSSSATPPRPRAAAAKPAEGGRPVPSRPRSEVELGLPVVGSPRPRDRDADPEPPSRPTYRVRPHDTLRGIARDTLRDSRRYREILELNRDVIDDPARLVSGQTLVLPDDAVVGSGIR